MRQEAARKGTFGAAKWRSGVSGAARLFLLCRSTWILLLAALLIAAPMQRGARAEMAAEASISTDQGYGRLVLTFPHMPKYEVRASTGVIVVTFDEKISVDLRKLPLEMRGYIAAARLDPDGMALRLALTQKVTINTMEAGEQLYMDFLPSGWVGLPPGLPEDVVARLAKLAEEAKQQEREAALRDAGLLDIPAVGLEVGQHPTFSRISFRWDRDIDAELTRSGAEVVIRFPLRGRVDLAALKGTPPRFVQGAEQELADGRLLVTLSIDRSASVRAFSEGRSFVVDVAGNAELFSGEALLHGLGEAAAGEGKDGAAAPAAGNASGASGASGASVASGATELAGTPAAPTAGVPVAAEEGAEKEEKLRIKTRIRAFDPSQMRAEDFADSNGSDFNIEDKKQSQVSEKANKNEEGSIGGQPVLVGDIGASGEEDGGARAPGGEAGAGSDPDARPVKMRAARIGDSIRLTFPFPDPVAASLFSREDTVWIVFDTSQRLDIAALRKFLGDRLRDAKLLREDDFQYLLLKLKRPSLTTIAAEASRWVVTLGETPLDPSRPLSLRRDYALDGTQMVRVEMADPGRIHWVLDPAAGDRLAVVTAMGPARGLIKSQDFVQFSTLVSAHGLAFRPVADDLKISLDKAGVTLSRGENGLWLTSNRPPPGAPGVGSLIAGRRPGFIDIAGIRHSGPAKFKAGRQQLEELAAMAPPNERLLQRLTLARFLVGYGLAAEALGVLDHMTLDDPQAVQDPVFNATRGIARVLMHRPAEALADLSHPGLAQSRDAALWRGLAQAQKLNWAAAFAAIADGENVLGDYPAELQTRFRLAAARAALELKDLPEAAHYIEAMSLESEDPSASADKALGAEIELMRARFVEAAGRSEEALSAYAAAISSPVRPVEAQARLRQTALLRRLGRIDADKAIDALETLTVSWRGDETELEADKLLGRLYLSKGEYRRAFELMRMAIAVDPESDVTRYIQDEMAIAFQDLFLHGKSDALEPIEALSLFYDYRDLTPIGRLGDEMIRKLSDRLIDVDLLDQAGELLKYQMDNRLAGAARSVVAVRLAYVYLLNREPDEALAVLQRTRHAGLPAETQRQRNLLEARALGEKGRSQLALELLDTMQGDDVERVKADTLWRSADWQAAAEQIERVIGEAWSGKDQLKAGQRFDVMRAAVAYALAGDQLGLDRLRDKFAAKMADSPDASAFTVVTQQRGTGQAAFEALARGITAADTLDAFLAEFRAKYSDAAGKGAAAQEGRS